MPRPLRVMRVLVALLGLLALQSMRALAHDRTMSYSVWEIRGRSAHVVLRLSQLDLTLFPWLTDVQGGDRALTDYLGEHLQLMAGDAPCAVSNGPRAIDAAPGRAVYEWDLTCAAAGSLQIRSGILLDVAPTHLHVARVHRDGAASLERVLSEGESRWALDGAVPTQGTTLAGYIVLGVQHIVSGYDHLAFLLALLLIGGSLADLAKVVTGFTVAHSITLALAVLGYVRPATVPIEALIGLSIVLVAAENIWLTGRRDGIVPRLIAGAFLVLALTAARGYGRVPALTLFGLAWFSLCYFGLLARVADATGLRWAIAFTFGLLHGFGFASALREAGLPAGRVFDALFGFNVGVELGQLAIVALAWPLVQAVGGRSEAWRLGLVQYGSAAVLSAGVFWFVTRAFS